MTIKTPYGAPTRPLPAPGTILADIVLQTPSQAFATINEICNRIGHHQRSIPAVIPIAVSRGYIEPMHVPRRYPQAYRLTIFGRLAKLALTAGD